MRVMELPRRRYSMPETIMRKYRLRQRGESGSSSSSGGCRRRRCADKSIQTSPRETFGRTSSLPFLATPSPCVWSYTTSDCQTVTERTTSTQDSTLSVPSTTPEGFATPLRTEEAETQVSLPDRTDRTTSVTGLETIHAEETVVDIAVSIKTGMSDETVVEATRCYDEKVRRREEKTSIACQTGNHGVFKVPEINVFKDSSDSLSEEKCLRVKEESSQVTMKDISEVMGSYVIKTRPEVACSGSNYEQFPLVNPVIPRYSSVPRTSSMVVNTSSLDYSSDSELSLTDSLEDPDEYRSSCFRKQTKHDEKMVRGEVTLEQEHKRLPKSRDAYAYFLSLTGEEEVIREYSVPDWLRMRLRRREQEIKKEYEGKFTRNKTCALSRRRKKTTRRITRLNSYSSSDKINRIETLSAGRHAKTENKTVQFEECINNNTINKNNLNPGPSPKNPSIQLVNGNNMGLEPKIDNIRRNNNNHCNNTRNATNPIEGEQSKIFAPSENNNKSNANSNLVQISEVIKIEMSDNLKTVITKEKQINLAPEMNLRESASETIKNEFSNSIKSVISKNGISNYTMEHTEHKKRHSSCQKFGKHDNHEKTTDQVNIDENFPNIENIPEIKEKHLTSLVKSTSELDSRATIKQDKTGSKIEIERTIADILITALEENTRARQMSMNPTEPLQGAEDKVEAQSKRFVDQGSQKNELVDQGSQKNEFENDYETSKMCSLAIQTDEILNTKKGNEEITNRCEVSCNTETYLVSVFVQTSDKESLEDDTHQETLDYTECDIYETETAESVDEVESSIGIGILKENKKMMDKGCNTIESESISTQTNESMLQSDDIVNRLEKHKSNKKRDVQFPPQVIKQIITGTGEYKTVESHDDGKSREGGRARLTGGKKGKVNKGINTEEADSVSKRSIDSSTDVISHRTAPTPFCKNVFPTKTHQKKSQVLEVNTPACTCHMCTLQRISPRGEQARSKIPQSRKISETRDERKQTQKVGTRRSNVIGPKFRMFEAIPEEKNSSGESFAEESSKSLKRDVQEKGILTELHLVDQNVQVGSNNVNAATNTEPNMAEPSKTAEGTQTSEQPKRKSNLVIGKFKSENQESPLLVRQYKGRASLSADHLEGQEKLLTLSKGWINFYLLNDNLDFSDSNEEGTLCQAQVMGRRRLQTVAKEEDKVDEYTVEIHATPEPVPRGMVHDRVTLPGISTSSSSSTPEGERNKPSKPAVEPLPGVKRSRRTRHSQINMTKEAITELGSAYRRRGDREKLSTRAVEVACSEKSISSITSSTVILSESPPPQQLKLPERRSYHRHRINRNMPHHLNNGTNWTVTVAGSSGSGNDPPPDVEMKLTFGKQGKKQEEVMHQYQVARAKRQDSLMEEFTNMSRNEKHTQVHCVLQTNQHPKSSHERLRGGTARDNFNYEEDYINRLSSRRSKYSTEDGSETTGDLHVTGLAITPEKKPRVPTQSERDILRPQRYKFTR